MSPNIGDGNKDGATAARETAPAQHLIQPKDHTARIATQAAYVAAHGGPGALTLAWRLFRLRHTGFGPEDYIDYGLWRPGVTRKDIAGFLPKKHNRPFNDALRDRRFPQMDSVIVDKLAALKLFAGLGLPVVPVTSIFQTVPEGGAILLPDIPIIRNEAALAAFLGGIGPEGIFGKPYDESFARGAFAADRSTAQGTLLFADGREVPVTELAAEIATHYPGGYVFQRRIIPDVRLRSHMGKAMGSLRLVTLMESEGPAVLYAVHKFPGWSAMHDSGGPAPRARAPINVATGQVSGLRRVDDPQGPLVSTWQNPDVPVQGMILPHYAQAVEIVIKGHGALPGHGILGWDIFLTDEGALISEVNANPMHDLYQQATQSGLLVGDPGRRLEARRRAVETA